MRHIHRLTALGIATLGLAVVTLGCSGATEPGRPSPRLTLTSAQSGVYPAAPPTATLIGVTATISGVMVTPTPCYTLSAGDRIVGDTLVVTLTARSSNVVCSQSLGFIGYTITSFDVPIPVTHLRVEQHGAAGGTPAVLLEQDFQRPKPV